MMRNIVTFILTLLVSNISFGQAKLFEANVISDNQEFGVSISPDGELLLLVKSYGGRDSLQMFQSKKIKGKWQKPESAFFANKNFIEIDPAFSPDGKSILYNSAVSKENGLDVFVIYKNQNGWSKPERLSDSINTKANEFYATMSLHKNVYFTRMAQSFDIYVSYFKDNKYQKAIPLELTINTEKTESNPYISPHEEYIIYYSDKTGGFGDSDLYISFKKKNKWSYPLNLGNKVNSQIGEFCPSVDLKNKLFIFSRTEVQNGKRVENIYYIPIKELKLKSLKRSAKWGK